jgi:6-phosphogluconolactonase
VTPNRKFFYTSNTPSDNITGFAVTLTGHLTVLNDDRVAYKVRRENGLPIDLAISGDSQFLYVLNKRADTIIALKIGTDGSLTQVQILLGIPKGSNGLAIR